MSMESMRFAVAVVLMTFLSGCATVGKKSDNPAEDPKDKQIQQLQNELKQRDEYIQRLEEARQPVTYSAPVVVDSGASAARAGGAISKSLNVSVKSVQQALQNAGFYQGKVDGVSGPKTKEAIRAFQASEDLSVDGVVGRKTWDHLRQHSA